MHATEIGQRGASNRPLLLAGSRLEPVAKFLRTGLVLGLSCFIVLGPAPGQLFGRHSPYLREWIMFAGAGIGVLKGGFALHRPDGTLVRMTPLEALGLKRYPSDPPYDFDKRVFDDRDLRAYVPRLCGDPAAAARVSFDGWVGTRQGWRPLKVADVCALAPADAPDPAGAKDDPP